MIDFWLTMALIAAVASAILLPITYAMSKLVARPAPDLPSVNWWPSAALGSIGGVAAWSLGRNKPTALDRSMVMVATPTYTLGVIVAVAIPLPYQATNASALLDNSPRVTSSATVASWRKD